MARAATQRIGEANKYLVLNEVRRQGQASIDELVRDTRKSQPTVLKWITALEQEGLLRRGGLGESTGGRPPTLYEFDPRWGYVLGVALEIPGVQVVLIDLDGQTVAGDAWEIETDESPMRLIRQLCERLEAFMASSEIPRERVVGCGMALSGFIDAQAGLLLASPRLPKWKEVSVRTMMAETLGLPVVLNHHIDALTLAEYSYGVASDIDQFLYFDVGYGLGVRFVKGGQPVPGVFGNAGLVGHTTVVPNGRLCVCGNRGCLEEYVSGRALLRHYASLTGNHVTGDVPGPVEIHAVAAELFDAAAAADAKAQEALDELMTYLVIGVANVVNVFDIPDVVVSGFAMHGGDALRAELEARVQAKLQPILAAATNLIFSSVPRPDAGSRGAALFALRAHYPFLDPLVVTERLHLEGGESTRQQRSLSQPAAIVNKS